MSGDLFTRRLIRLAGSALALVLFARTHAEVGAAPFPGSIAPRAVLYTIAAIGDDPDPFTGIWATYNQNVPGRIILNPGGNANGDGAPSSVVDASGDLIVVAWSRHSAAGFDVVVSRFLDGAWTTLQVVAGDSSVDELDPQLTLGPDGTVHMFYWVNGPTPQVFYTHAPADLSTWTSPVLVSQGNQPSCRPAGAFYGGVLRVAYEVHDFGFGNSPRQIVLARQDGAGFTPEIVALTNNLGEVRPQIHSQSGRVWIDWVDAETSGSGEVAWTRLDAQGQWEPLRYEPFASVEQRDYLVRGGVRMKALQ